MKKLLALLLATLLTLSMYSIALSEEGRNFYDYHDYSQYPLGDGSSDAPTIKLALYADPTYHPNAWDTWFWPWMKQASGLNFDIEQVLTTAISEKKNLMFAADDLPDAIIGFNFTPSELVKYGQIEGQLLPLNKYITPEIMPNLSKWLEDFPETYALITAPDGNIYSFPKLDVHSPGNEERFFWNKNWLAEVNAEVPQTLDECLEILYAMKKAHPDTYPLGGGAKGNDPRSYILNAFGFLTEEGSDEGYGLALKEGELVIPGGTALYKEYLTIMHQLYVDEIINPSFFSMEKTAIESIVAEDQCGAYPSYVYTITPEVEKFQQWTSCVPMTSQWSDARQWLRRKTVYIGGCVLSANYKDAELFCRWLDFLYSDLGAQYCWDGPAANNDDCMDLTGGYIIDPETNSIAFPDVMNGAYENNYGFILAKNYGLGSCIGNMRTAIGHPEWRRDQLDQIFYGLEPVSIAYDVTNGDGCFRESIRVALTEFETSDFPYQMYFDEETNLELSDLSAVINPYIEAETAKFITGVRDLSEFDKYLDELKSLNFDKYLGIYLDSYNSTK